MKKLISVLLSVTMCISTVSAFAAGETLSEATVSAEAAGEFGYDFETGFYANRECLTIPFTANVGNIENIEEYVALSNSSGTELSFDTVVENNNLILIPKNEFELEEIYIFTIKNGIKSLDSVNGEDMNIAFKVTAVSSTDLSNETNLSEVFYSSNEAGMGNQTKYALYDGYAYTVGYYNMLYLNGDYSTYKNYTVEFPLKLFSKNKEVAIAFNNQERKMSEYVSDTSFGWINDTTSNYHKPAYKINKAQYITDGNADKNITPEYNSTTVTWNGNDKITRVGNANKINYYRIDKIGAKADLYLKTSPSASYSLVDSFDTSALGDNVPETGYFGVGTRGRTTSPTVAIGDVLITTSIEVELEEKEIKLSGNCEFTIDSAVLTFDSDMSPVTAGDMKQYINVISSDGEGIECSYNVDGNSIIITPKSGFEPMVDYTITIGEGLGYLKTRVKEDIVKTFNIPVIPISVTVSDKSDMDIDTKKITVPLDTDISDISEENVKKYVTLTDSEGLNISFTAEVDAEFLVIKPESELKVGSEYILKIGKGFGFKNKLLQEDFEIKFDIDTVRLEIDGAIYANAKKLTVPLNKEIQGIEDYSLLSLTDENRNLIDCDYGINGNVIEIMPKNGFERDIVYTLEIKKDFGVGVYRVTEDINRSFRIKTIIAPDFENDSIDSYLTYSASAGAKCFNVVDNKLYYNFGVGADAYSNVAYLKSEDSYTTKENYSVSFDVEYYGGIYSAIGFNADSNTRTFTYPGPGVFTAFAWYTDPYSQILQKAFYLNGSGVNGAQMFENADKEVKLISADSITYDENFAITNIPDGAVSYNYTIDKMGTAAYLSVDNELVDTYITQKAIDYWNETYDPDKGTPVSYDAPSSGYFGIGASAASPKIETIAIANLQMTEFEEVVKTGNIELRSVDTSYNGRVLNSSAVIKNYNNTPQNAKAGIFVYGDNNKPLAGQIVGGDDISPNSTKEYSVTFNVSEAKILRVLLWKNNNDKALICEPYIYDLTENKVIKETDISAIGTNTSAGIENASIINFDYNADTNYIISVKGNVSKSESDRYLNLFILRSDLENDIMSGKAEKIEPAYGAAADIFVKAGNTSFEYKFEFDNNIAPTDGSYNYKIVLVDAGNNFTSSFDYVNEQDAIDFVSEDLKNVNITFEELKKYSACLGIDVSEFNNESKQNTLITDIKAEKNTISASQDIVSAVNKVVKKDSAKLIILRKIHNEALTAADVNKVITQYASEAELDLTKYNKLSDQKKTGVCNSFIGKNYETLGFDKFKQEFDRLVTNASSSDNGGGTGGNGGSGNPGSNSGSNSGGIAVGSDKAGVSYSDVSKIMGAMEIPFDDMSGFEWAEEYVKLLYNKKIISGVTENKFAPGDSVTREQLAVMIVKAYGIDTDNVSTEFGDISKDRWSYKFIAAAKENGIIYGDDKGNFNPDRNITREDMTVMLYRASLKLGTVYEKEKTDFMDYNNISEYAKEAVAYMVGEGYISGFGDGTFMPKEAANRAQAAKLICVLTIGDK